MVTYSLSEEEVKNKRVAAGVSVVMHILIILLLFYVLAWSAADPPAPELGIELNIGMDAVGSGDIQSTATPNKSEKIQDSKPAPTEPEPEPQKTAQPVPPTPVETPKVVTTTADAPVAVKEEVKPVVKPKPKEEVKKEPEPVVRKEALMGKKTDNTGTGKAGTSDQAAGNNNGNDADKVGDKGVKDGSLMSKNYDGNSGGGAGGLDMAGWGWGNMPRPRDTSNENGKVVIKILVNEEGVVENATVVESTVSPHISKLYRDEVFKKATFVKKGAGSSSSGLVTGYITYIIKSN